MLNNIVNSKNKLSTSIDFEVIFNIITSIFYNRFENKLFRQEMTHSKCQYNIFTKYINLSYSRITI